LRSLVALSTLGDVRALHIVAVGHVVRFICSAWSVICLWGRICFFVCLAGHCRVFESDGPTIISASGLPHHEMGCSHAQLFIFKASKLLDPEVDGLMFPKVVWVWLGPLPGKCGRFLAWRLMFPGPRLLSREIFVCVLRVSAFQMLAGCHECQTQSVP